MPRYIPYMSVDSPEHVAGSLELRKIKNQLDEDLKTLNLTIDPESTPEKRKKAAKKLYSKYNKKRNKFSLNPDKDFENLYIDPIILMQLHKELGELKDATNELLRKTMLNYANNSFLSPYYLQSPVKSNTLEGALEYFNVAKNATNEPFSTAAFMASPAFSSLLLGSLGYMASDKVAEDAGLTGTDKKITGIAGGVTTGLLSYLTHGAFKNIRKTLELVDEMKKGPIDIPYTELNSNLIKNTQKYLPANSKTYFLVTGNRPLLPAPKPTIISLRLALLDEIKEISKRNQGKDAFYISGKDRSRGELLVKKINSLNSTSSPNDVLDWSPKSWFANRPAGSSPTEEEIVTFKKNIPEYLEILKNAGDNWLKMPDGSIWQGDPREWVIMQSEAFKKFMENSKITTTLTHLMSDFKGNTIREVPSTGGGRLYGNGFYGYINPTGMLKDGYSTTDTANPFIAAHNLGTYVVNSSNPVKLGSKDVTPLLLDLKLRNSPLRTGSFHNPSFSNPEIGPYTENDAAIITGRRNIVLSGFPNNRGEAYPALKFVTGNTGEFSHPTNIFRFTNSVGEEVVPTPYQGTSEQFDNAAMKGIQIGFKYRMSPKHRAKTKNTMNWDDLAMQEFINELNILAGGQIDYLPLKMTEEFTDRAQHSGKVFTKDGKVTGIVHTLKLNEDRLPTDRDVIEATAHEMGGHGLTASIDVDSLDKILKKFFPRTYEVIQKDKELADLILVLKEGVDTSSPRYKYVRGSNELPTRVVTDNAFDAFGLSNLNNTSGFATTGVLELEDFFTPESLQEYKGEVLDTGVNTSRFYDPKDPELILAAIDAWNTRYPNSGLELITPRDYRGYNNEPIKLIGILPFSQKVKDTAELMKLRWERYNYDKTHLGAMIDGNYLWTTNGINKFFEFLTSDGRHSRIYLPYNRNSNTTGFYGDLDGLWLKLYPERPKPYDYTQFHEGISHPTDRIVEKMTTPVAGKKVLEPVARLFGGVKYSNSMYGRISYPMDIYPQEMIDKYLSPSAQNPREARATNWEEIMKIYSEIAKKYNISYKDAITTKKDVFEKIIDNMSLNEFKNFLLRMDNAYVRDYVKLMNAGTEDLANLWLRRFKGALKYGPIVTGVIAGTAASNNRYGGKLIKKMN